MSYPIRLFLTSLFVISWAVPAASAPPSEWTWQNPLPQGNNLEAVWGRSPTEVYAIGGQTTLMHWDGGAWSVAERPSSLPVYDLWGLDSGDIFAAGYDGTVVHFDGVSWAPLDGYSYTGTSELIIGHIYVVEIRDPIDGIHYAKFGVTDITPDSVDIIWAYQTIPGLQELSVPEKPEVTDLKPVTISF